MRKTFLIGHPRPLFNLFSSFQTNITIFKINVCEMNYLLTTYIITFITFLLLLISIFFNRSIRDHTLSLKVIVFLRDPALLVFNLGRKGVSSSLTI